MLLVFTPNITNRVRYIFKLIFTDILGVEINITSNRDEFRSYTGIKISYSQQQLNDEIFFSSSPLLFEKGIEIPELSVFDFEGMNVFFPVEGNSSLPFDPFASSFYLTSRYEEYLPYKKDRYGRYDPRCSIAFKNGILAKPIVNIWAEKIFEVIKAKYPGFSIPQRDFRHVPTIDVDVAFAFLERGFWRTMGGYAKALFNLDPYDIIDRTRVLNGSLNDPFDTYVLLKELHHQYNLKPVYFFLLGDYGSKDKNVSYTNNKLRALIKRTKEYADIGIHPSYISNKHPSGINKEISRLSGIVEKEITQSRQHFLMLQLPETYLNLINSGIKDDYTMGYSSMTGFRAGICTPFYFYDLIGEKETKLRVHPLSVMDVTLKDHLSLSPEKAKKHVQGIIDEIRSVKGTFISLWHNQALSNYREWKDWREVYEQIIQKAG